MKSKKIYTYLIYIIGISVMTMTACSYTKHTNYDKNLQSQPLYNYKLQNNKNYTENIQPERNILQQNNNVIYFDLDRYNISTQFFYILNNYANFLYNYPLRRITIEGHTDERGTPEYNIALGERRANAVKLYLQSKGVLSKQIFIVSYGKEKPAVLGHNEQTYSKNRRAVLIYQ